MGKRTRNKIFLFVILLLVLLLAMLMIFKVAYKPKSIVFDKKELEKQIGLIYSVKKDTLSFNKNVLPLSIDSIYEYIYIDSVYLNGSQMAGFEYQLESNNFGIAKCYYAKNGSLEKIVFYNSLRVEFNSSKPFSFLLKIFSDGKRKIIFDELNEKLYICDNAVCLKIQ